MKIKKRKAVFKLILEVVYKAAKNEAVRSANSTCESFFYQPKTPDAVKKLRKF